MMEVIMYGMRMYSRKTINPDNSQYLDYLDVSIDKGSNKLVNKRNGGIVTIYPLLPLPNNYGLAYENTQGAIKGN